MQNVVILEWIEKNIAVVTMQDLLAKNTFSNDLIEGLYNSFNEIKKNENAKVVVIKGSDAYFCCGGTKDSLLKLADRQMTFADMPFYRLLLDCELPVIAAMQGHALGGGLAFSAFSDEIILAEESSYASNFLNYGFTPGFGATYIMPKKFGPILGAELLYTAQVYEGRDLKARNLPMKIVKKKDVLDTAMMMAKKYIDKTVISLKLLKKQSTQQMKIELPKYIEDELAMHSILFKSPDTRAMIDKNFPE